MRRMFALLMLGLLAGACRTLVASEAPTATPSPSSEIVARVPSATAAPTITPFVMPTPPPAPTPICPDAPPTRLLAWDRGRVLDDDPRSVRIRGLPSLDSDIVAYIPVEGVFFIITGPRCEEGYAWYFVRYGHVEGWIAEGDFTSYFVEPYPPAG